MPQTGVGPGIISAPRFYFQPTGGGKPAWNFSEMNSISTEVEAHEFIYCDQDGAVQHTKQYGKTVPPSVTLVKPMDADRALWAWHMSVQCGNQLARITSTLSVFPAGSPDLPPQGQPLFQWTLEKAWPARIEVSNMQAGSTQTGTLTVTFACDLITVLGANGSATGPAFST
ncbi:MAG TPA: phage tail protein [Streptosporangiaceae bacterium]